jgi:hypothetical protein
MLLASQSGMEMGVLDRLRLRLLGNAGDLPTSIPGWVDWILDWLGADGPARLDLLSDTARAVNASLGRGAELTLTAGTMQALKPAARAWLEGRPLNEVERLLGGTPNGATASQRQLPRAREFVSTVVPRSLAFLAGVVARMTQERGLAEDGDNGEPVLRALSGAVRRGFDTVPKLEFANANRRLVGRVATHLAYDEAADD